MTEARTSTSIPSGPAAIAARGSRPRVVAAAMVALVLSGAAAAGCSSSGSAVKKSTDTTTSTVPDTTTTAPADTTAAPTTAAPTTAAPATTASTQAPSVTAVPSQCAEAGADSNNPDPAAQAVFIAWTRGDRACAAELMAPKALDSLFVRDGSGATDQFQGCDHPGIATVDCAFTYEGGATHYKMVFGAGRWKVDDVYQVAD